MALRCRGVRDFLGFRRSLDLFGSNIRGFGRFLGGGRLFPGVLGGFLLGQSLDRFGFRLRIFKRLEISGHRQLNLLDHFFADARNFGELFRRHVG